MLVELFSCFRDILKSKSEETSLLSPSVGVHHSANPKPGISNTSTRRLATDVEEAIEGIKFIVQHLKEEDEYERVKLQ